MSAERRVGIKCTPEECRLIGERVRAAFPVLEDERALAERARAFQALGNETRLQILAMLSVQEMCACNLVSALGVAASTLAHHLRTLEDAGLIRSRQEGKFTLYELDLAAVARYRVFALLEGQERSPLRSA